ncbi:MAG: DUF5991 domain-containing protein [Acidobacteriota bacterium]
MREFVFIVLGLLIFPLHASAQSDWKGSYRFDEDGGKNAGGAAIVISHELTIFDSGEGLAARFQSNGYQTSTDLVCTVRSEGSKIMLFFQSYGEDNMFEPYTPGDLLFTLEHKVEKGKPGILTYWGKFTPVIARNSKSGKVYFEKPFEKQ